MKKSDPARIRGEEVYDDFVNSGEEFTADEVKLALRSALAEFQDQAYASLVEEVFDAVDRPRSSDDDGQRTLFYLGGVYRLGEGRRIAKRFSQLEHAQEAFFIDTANMQSVVLANSRKRQELDLLMPYWGAGRTKEEALEAYRKDHPDEQAA